MKRTYLVLHCCLIASLLACSPEKQTKSEQPNIVYILADDLGYGDLSAFGQTHFSTPNLDKLAAGGMKFTRHYSGSTVCAPSRSALMTGQHTGHTFIRGNTPIGKPMPEEGQYPLDSAVITLAEILQQNGYSTGGFGKWGLGSPGSEGDANFQGFNQFFGYNCQALAHNYYPLHLWDNQTKVELTENQGEANITYAPELIHKNSLSFIENNKDNPFFLYYPMVIPHAELAAPESEIAKFRDKFSPDKEYVGAVLGDKNFKKGAYASQTETHATFAAMVTLLDQQVGEVMAKLEELGIADNTLIVFTSDNGPHLEGGADPDYFDSNGPLKGYKRDFYEGGVRVPMIAYWKNEIAAGTESDHISAFWDFLPTVCEMLNIQTPENLDGISFLPTLLGKKEQKKHDYLYWEFYEQGGKQAVLMDNWKCIKLNVNKPDETTYELYDLSTDLGEEHNLAQENPEMLKKGLALIEDAHEYSPIFHFPFENTQE